MLFVNIKLSQLKGRDAATSPVSLPLFLKGAVYMDDKLINLLKAIESLSKDELEKVKAWVEFNLLKR